MTSRRLDWVGIDAVDVVGKNHNTLKCDSRQDFTFQNIYLHCSCGVVLMLLFFFFMAAIWPDPKELQYLSYLRIFVICY